MNEIKKFVSSLSEEPNNRYILSLYRIYLGVHIFKKFYLFLPFTDSFTGDKGIGRPLISHSYYNYFFDYPPYISDILYHNYDKILYIGLVFSFLFIIGWGKKITTIVLWVILFIHTSLFITGATGNGGDNFLKFSLFYFIFCQSHHHFTLYKRNTSRLKNVFINRLSNLLSNIFSKSIAVHLCIVYFISGLSKAIDTTWNSGEAIYYIFQIERFNKGEHLLNIIIDSPLLIFIFSYGTILVEIFFPIVMIDKKARNIILFLTFCMHLGIYRIMMINDFSILYVVSYMFFFNDEEIKKCLGDLTGIKKYLYDAVSIIKSFYKKLLNTLNLPGGLNRKKN